MLKKFEVFMCLNYPRASISFKLILKICEKSWIKNSSSSKWKKYHSKHKYYVTFFRTKKHNLEKSICRKISLSKPQTGWWKTLSTRTKKAWQEDGQEDRFTTTIRSKIQLAKRKNYQNWSKETLTSTVLFSKFRLHIHKTNRARKPRIAADLDFCSDFCNESNGIFFSRVTEFFFFRQFSTF